MDNPNDIRNRHWEEIQSVDSPTYHCREMIIQSLLPHEGKGKRALDIGCGTGRHVGELLTRGFFVDAIDPSSYAIGVTREKAQKLSDHFKIYRCGIEEFEAKQHYDFILASEVLEHIEDDREALKKVNRYLTSTGRVLITVPHDMRLWSTSDEISGHHRRYTTEELKEKLESAGFKIITLTCYGFPFLQMLLELRKWITRKEGVKREGVLRETLTQRKTGRLMVRVLTVISMIDRLNLFPHRGVGIGALVEKAHS